MSTAEGNASEKSQGVQIHIVIDLKKPKSFINGSLLNGAANGNLEEAEEALARGADPNAREGNGVTALYIAANRGHLRLVELLVDAGAEINAPSGPGISHLRGAVVGGHADIVKFLLERGANVNEVDQDHHSPLSVAAIRGEVAIARLLLDYKAEVNGSGGMSPLAAAAFEGRTQLVRLLLDRGANPALQESGATALQLAAYKMNEALKKNDESAMRQYYEVFEMLKAAGGS